MFYVTCVFYSNDTTRNYKKEKSPISYSQSAISLRGR